GRDVAISLTKTPDIADVANGSATPVTYTYVVKNTGASFAPSGNLVEDNGTPGNTGDDINVGSWGPLAPGASQTLTSTRPIGATTTNIAVASGTSGNAPSNPTRRSSDLGRDVAISLTKTPDIADVANGSATPVTYTYV